MVLSCIKNRWQCFRSLPHSVMTFSSQHITFWYCNMKKSKTSNHKNACKMKNIWLVCKKLQYSINFYSFSTTFLKYICFLEMVFLVSLFWQWSYLLLSGSIILCPCPVITKCSWIHSTKLIHYPNNSLIKKNF